MSTDPSPLPEGMETTAEERTHWLSVYAGKTFNELPMLLRTIRDLDRALAEIARLTEANALLGREIARLTAALAEARELLRRMDAGEPAAHMEPLSQTDLIDIIRKGGP